MRCRNGSRPSPGQLDDTVREIRTTIFDLHTAHDDGAGESVRRRLLDVVTETCGDRLQPTLRMSGALDSLVTGELAADLEAVVREGVSTVARHARATNVTVTVDVGSELVVEVIDDGGASISAARAAGCATSRSGPSAVAAV